MKKNHTPPPCEQSLFIFVLYLNCIKHLRLPKLELLYYSQSCFLLSNWFSECEHQFIDNKPMVITEPVASSARLLIIIIRPGFKPVSQQQTASCPTLRILFDSCRVFRRCAGVTQHIHWHGFIKTDKTALTRLKLHHETRPSYKMITYCEHNRHCDS